MMQPSNGFQRTAELFDRARQMPPADREAFLKRECRGDRELYNEVVGLLRHHEDTQSPLEGPLLPPSSMVRLVESAATNSTALPKQIGRYRITRMLGSGGMGIVFLAEQENPRRQVAVKIVRPAHSSSEVLKRFKLEAAVLGSLQHPGIAQIHEAGVHDDEFGEQPFFAMEFIDGTPLNEYLRTRRTTLNERLRLFVKICDAVHYAHQKGIVHRDLKPANLFVVEPTSQAESAPGSASIARLTEPHIKILDFGVARIMDSDLQVTELQTQFGQLIGTVPYMSPEQILGQTKQIDQRSDVYSLGVILYEMLAGMLPYSLKTESMWAAAEAIAEREPRPLAAVDRSYRGDLNTIVMRALEKEPSQRYASAADMAGDVERLVANQPILARPPSTLYQFRKFARRHRGLVAGVSAAFFLLIAGIIGTTTQAIRATRQKNQAQREKELAQAEAEFSTEINNFYYRMLNSNQPTEVGGSVTIEQALDHAAQSIESSPPENLRVEAEIRRAIGASYVAVGNFKRARHHLEFGLEKAIAYYGPQHAALLDHLIVLATLYSHCDLDDLAEQTYRRAILLAEAVGDSAALASANHGLAFVLADNENRAEECETYARRALELTMHGSHTTAERAGMLEVLANSQFNQGKFQDSESTIGLALALLRTDPKIHRGQIGSCLPLLARICSKTNRREQAVEIYREVLGIQSELWSEDHPLLTTSHLNLGIALRRLSQWDEAEKELRLALRIAEKSFSELNPRLLAAQAELGNLLMSTNRLDEAEPLLTHVLEARVKVTPETRDTSISMMNVANLHKRRGRFDLALPAVEGAFELRKRLFGPHNSMTQSARRLLAETTRKLGELDRSESLYREIFEINTAKFGPNHSQTLQARRELSEVLRELGRDREADRLVVEF